VVATNRRFALRHRREADALEQVLQVFDPGRIVLSAIHAVIGITGILVMRRLPAQ